MSGSRIILRSGKHVDVAKDVLDVYDLLASMRDEGAGLDDGFLVTSAEIIRVAAIEAVIPR